MVKKTYEKFLREIAECDFKEKNSLMEFLKKEVKRQPHIVIHYIKLSVFYLEIRDFNSAMKYVKSAILLNPCDKNLWLYQAYIYEKKGYYMNAFHTYYKAYKMGSEEAKEKLQTFLNNKNILDKLQTKQKEELEKLSASI